MTDIGSTAQATAAAVTGPDTPDAVKVTRKPPGGTVGTLFAALAVVCGMAGLIIGILTWAHWPEITSPERIKYLGWMGLTLIGCIPLIVFALISPWVGKVEASAGPGHITLAGRE